MHSFSIDGFSAARYGLFVSGSGTYNAPERDVTTVEIPGRNGELTIDNGRFKNITVTYPAFIVGDFQQRAQNIRAWLCSTSGYRRLEDDYDTGHFRMARFINGLEFNTLAQNGAGRCNIQFDCMPQRFLLAGEIPVTLAVGGRITNPTLFDAEPLITVNGNGNITLTVNGKSVVLTGVSGSVTLDCATKRAYNGTTPMDSIMTGEFPVLVPGNNVISWTGSANLSIVPRWWTV